MLSKNHTDALATIFMLVLFCAQSWQFSYADKVTSLQKSTSSKPTTANSPKYHRVEEGESLSEIALKSGHSSEEIAAWNHIQPPYKVYIGRQLRLFNPETTRITKAKTKPSPAPENQLKNQLALPSQSTPKKIPNQNRAATTSTRTAKGKKSVISIDNKKMLKLNFSWPINGKVVKIFAGDSHKGINIACKSKKQTVLAAESGKIVYAGGGMDSFKNLIIIKHNDVYLTAYANNSQLLVEEGQYVQKKQAIAEIGDGVNKATALHFEIRKNGKPIDPLTLLPK